MKTNFLNGEHNFKSYYQKLYKLQDKILNLIKNMETVFYLTGGTALNRFYFPVRYSDDLDFFTNDNTNFKTDYLEIKRLLTINNISFKEDVNTKDFKRIVVSENDLNLKIDFVNDRTPLIYPLISKSGIILDNPLNILINKISCILSRDEPRDVVDIITIALHVDFDWYEILINTSKKEIFEYEYLIYRLESFPKELLKKVSFIKKDYLEKYARYLDILLEDIKNKDKNRLKEKCNLI